MVGDSALDEVSLGDGFPLIALGLKECAPFAWKVRGGCSVYPSVYLEFAHPVFHS